MFYYELVAAGIDLPYRTRGKIKLRCPQCGGGKSKEKSLYVNYTEGLYKCYRATCGWSGKARKKTYQRPTFNNRTDLPDRVVKYFERRGISQKTLRKMKITTDEKGNIQFNYFWKGEIVNVKTRFEVNGEKSFRQHVGAEKVLYNADSLANATRCIIVEGEMDALSFVEAGVPSGTAVVSLDQGAASPGQKADGKLECVRNCAAELDHIKEFLLCLDKDAPGMWMQEELIRRLGSYRCSIVHLPEGKKDANEVLQSQQDASANRQTLRMCIEKAEQANVSGIMSLTGETREALIDVYFKGRAKGSTTHFPSFDENFTFLAGDITVISGVPGMGKSQFTRNLMVLKAMHDGWKWAVFGPEDAPSDYFYQDLVEIYIGKPFHGEGRMDELEMERGVNFIAEHFHFIYPEISEDGQAELPDNEWINKRIDFLRLKYGVNAYVKDPWNKIMHKYHNREDEYLARELTKEGYFAKQYDAALYVAHPVGSKVKINKDGEYEVPSPYMLSGGSMWFNMMDNIFMVHRPERSNPVSRLVEVHVQKVRKKKQVGQEGMCEFIFDLVTRRYKSENVIGAGGYDDPFNEIVEVNEEDIPF